MPDSKCSIDGCDARAEKRGWCSKHYWRWRKWGDPQEPSHKGPQPWAQKFWPKVAEGPGNCWQWLGTIGRNGYGGFHDVGIREQYAHRSAYVRLIGPIPGGLQLDHLCRNRACVNPAHLEPVTQHENTLRGDRATRTVCINGHPLTPENTYNRRSNVHGKRDCRVCRKIRQRAYVKRLRARSVVEAVA